MITRCYDRCVALVFFVISMIFAGKRIGKSIGSIFIIRSIYKRIIIKNLFIKDIQTFYYYIGIAAIDSLHDSSIFAILRNRMKGLPVRYQATDKLLNFIVSLINAAYRWQATRAVSRIVPSLAMSPLISRYFCPLRLQ